MSKENNQEKEEEKVKEIIPSELNARQEIFCRNFSTSKEFFGNGVQSYIDAYNIDISKPGQYESAKQCAYNLLTNVDILNRINQLLDLAGFNDENVDKQLNMVICQQVDLKAKISAIKEYNLLKKRVSNKIMDFPTDGNFKMTIEKEEPKPVIENKDEGNKVETNSEAELDLGVSQ